MKRRVQMIAKFFSNTKNNLTSLNFFQKTIICLLLVNLVFVYFSKKSSEEATIAAYHAESTAYEAKRAAESARFAAESANSSAEDAERSASSASSECSDILRRLR